MTRIYINSIPNVCKPKSRTCSLTWSHSPCNKYYQFVYCVSRSSWNSRYCERLVGRCLYCVSRSSWNSRYCERLVGRCLYCVSRSSWNSRYCERLVGRCLYCVSRSSWNSRYCVRLVGDVSTVSLGPHGTVGIVRGWWRDVSTVSPGPHGQ